MGKNKFSVLGMLAMVLALGLTFASCDPGGGDEPYDGPKTIKITGFNVSNSQMLFIFVSNEPGCWPWPPVAGGRTGYSESGLGSDITVELKDGTDDDEGEPWTGTGKYYIWIQVQIDGEEKRSVYHYTVDGVTQVPVTAGNLYDAYNMDDITNAALIDISDAITILDFTKFVYRGKDLDAG
jgi:hypothetical protein